jgi:hypothetical protein
MTPPGEFTPAEYRVIFLTLALVIALAALNYHEAGIRNRYTEIERKKADCSRKRRRSILNRIRDWML